MPFLSSLLPLAGFPSSFDLASVSPVFSRRLSRMYTVRFIQTPRISVRAWLEMPAAIPVASCLRSFLFPRLVSSGSASVADSDSLASGRNERERESGCLESQSVLSQVSRYVHQKVSLLTLSRLIIPGHSRFLSLSRVYV